MDTTTENTNEARFTITGDWASQSVQLKNKFSALTDEDLQLEEGKEEELLVRIGARLEKTRDEVIAVIQEGLPEAV